MEKWRKEEHQNNVKKAGSIATIYGELWELLYFLKADRVYLIQPHPLYREMFISATLEVKKYGVSSVRESLCDIKIESVANFVSELANQDYLFIKDIESSNIRLRNKNSSYSAMLEIRGSYKIEKFEKLIYYHEFSC